MKTLWNGSIASNKQTHEPCAPTRLSPLGAPCASRRFLLLCWLSASLQVCDVPAADLSAEPAYELSTFALPESLKLEVSGMALLPRFLLRSP